MIPLENDPVKAVEEALAGRGDLDIYRHNKRLLFAVQLRLGMDDIHTLAAEALTDGPDDKSCDLIYVDRESGLMLLAQGYEATAARAVKQTKVASLHQAVAWVFSHDVEKAPERLRPAINEVRSALGDDAIREVLIWFVHNLPHDDQVHHELQAIGNNAMGAIRAKYPELTLDVRSQEIDRETLAEWYVSSRTPILVADEISVPADSYLTDGGSGWSAYTVTVSADWLNNIYWRYKEKLFSANVRGFLGARRSTENINNGMRVTLEAEPSNFWSYNNGITALVNDIRYMPDDHVLSISGISIVNGAQTTGALAEFSDPVALQAARIVMRFIKCGDPVIVQKIIKFNNRQNATDPADFRSNDRVQLRLVTEFAALGVDSYTGGRRGIDVPKGGGGVVDVESASRALAAYHGDPKVAYNETRRIWEDDLLYRRLFSDATNARHIFYCWSLLKAVEEQKLRIRALPESKLTKKKRDQRDYFDRRGAVLLLVSAVAECVDEILGQRVEDSYRVGFSGDPSPAECIAYWGPIVDAFASLAHTNLTQLLEAGGPPKQLDAMALRGFSDQVEVMVGNGDERWAAFSDKVTQKY